MDDEDGRHLAETLRVLSETGTWAARTNADAARLRPAPGSKLFMDDEQAHPYELSHAAWHLLSNAVDHLGCLQALLGDAQIIHMFAPFTLVRGALENACGAVWLLRPDQGKDRLARRLRLALADVRNGEQVKQLTGQPGPRSQQERINQIHDIASLAGLGTEALKGNAAYSEIVKAVDAGMPGSLILVAWKVGSGFAHGDWWTTLSGSRRTLIPGATQEGVGTFKIEANLSLLMQMTTLAVDVTRRGWQLHDERCRPPS